MNNCWHCGRDYDTEKAHLCTAPPGADKQGRSFSEEVQAMGDKVVLDMLREEVRAEDAAVLDGVYEPRVTTLPTDSAERKGVPLHAGVMRYFPAALAAVARVSKAGNDKHNGKGSPLQHTRGLSMDHADCILRHLMDMEEQPIDPISGLPEVFNVAWRALALCQQWCEDNMDAPLAPGASND